MRLIILTCAVFVFGNGFALAADEFGSRFSEQTPSALEDPEQALQDAMQDIEPAAGAAAEKAETGASGGASSAEQPEQDQDTVQE